MKILVIHNHYQFRAGEDQVVAAEIELLRHHGHDVIVFTRDNADIPSFSWLRKLISIIGGFASYSTCRDLRRVIKTSRPDVVHVHNVFPLISPAIYRAIKRHGLPVVQTIHNYRFLCPNGLFFMSDHVCPHCDATYLHCIANRCYRSSTAFSLWYSAILAWHRFLRTFQNCIDRYIVMSTFAREVFVRAGFDERKFSVKPNAATLTIPPVDQPDDYVLFVGRCAWEKGILTLIKAAALVPSLKVKVIGSGPLDPQMCELVASRNLTNVELMGQQPHCIVEHHLAHALALVFPSLCYENCPMVVVNSLWAGTPVVAARTGGIPGFVPEEIAGWLCTPGSVDELATKLAWIADNKEAMRRMRPAVRAWGIQQFNKEKSYATLMKVYTDAIAAGQPGP